jgi:hypothetical protein
MHHSPRVPSPQAGRLPVSAGAGVDVGGMRCGTCHRAFWLRRARAPREGFKAYFTRLGHRGGSGSSGPGEAAAPVRRLHRRHAPSPRSTSELTTPRSGPERDTGRSEDHGQTKRRRETTSCRPTSQIFGYPLKGIRFWWCLPS